MRRYIQAICIMATVCLCASCLGSDDDYYVSSYNDTAITSFSLGTLNRYLTTTSSTGEDSIYKTTYSAGTYVFTIDHYQRKIYNTDSLPYGTDAEHVLATINSKNGGTIVIKSLTSDSLSYYNSSDSIDFSQTREVRVYALDGSHYRPYLVTLNVHQVEQSGMYWERMQAGEYPADDTKAAWEQAATAAGMKQFIGAGRAHGYAYDGDGQLMVSSDGGATWQPDNLDESSNLLPTEGIAFLSWPYATNEQTDYHLLVGATGGEESSENDVCVVWRKIDEYATDSEPSKWVYIPVDKNNVYLLPRMEHISLLHYQGMVLAIGTDGNIYESRDQGITWKKSTTYTLPEELGTKDVNATADGEGYIWLEGRDTGEVWRGKRLD